MNSSKISDNDALEEMSISDLAAHIKNTYVRKELTPYALKNLAIRDDFHERYGYAQINPILSEKLHLKLHLPAGFLLSYGKKVYGVNKKIPLYNLMQESLIYYNVSQKALIESFHEALDRNLIELLPHEKVKINKI